MPSNIDEDIKSTLKSGMRRQVYNTVSQRDHRFVCPLSSERADRLVDLMALAPGARVLDAGCGKGELLIRLVERYGVSGVGVDHNPAFIEEGRAQAAARVPEADLLLYDEAVADLVRRAGMFDAAVCMGATGAFGGLRETLRVLADALPNGGQVLVGARFWRKLPDAEFLYQSGLVMQELRDHAGNVALAEELGYAVLFAGTATDEEWDVHEGLGWRAIEMYAAEHPGDLEAIEMLGYMRRRRKVYLTAGRETLGFGYYLLRW